MSRDEFLEEVRQLKDLFASLDAELEVTIRNPELNFEAYVVVWNTAISAGGPLALSGKGGTRITPQVTLEETKQLAKTMALKNAAAGLPLGGAKSALKASSDEPDFEKKYRAFVRQAKPLLYENGGIFGGFGFDLGAKPQHALWACDELQSNRSFTGKPLELGGTDYDRIGIAGLGVAAAARQALRFYDLEKQDLTYCVQGLGAMGAAVVRYFSSFCPQAKLKAISDLRLGGTYIFEEQIPSELIELISKQDLIELQKLLSKIESIEFVPAVAAVLTLETDVLFPCATQGVVSPENVDLVRAKFLVEGANNPCSDSERERLHERGIVLIPDFIANPGGIIAAFVELTIDVDNQQNVLEQIKPKAALEYTEQKIAENVQHILETAKAFNVSPLQAAWHLALSRMFANSK